MEWKLFADVPAEELRRLLTIARRRTFARNEVVFHRDDPADTLHLIVSGRFVARVTTPLGEVAALAVLGPGETFGEMALVSPAPRRSATVSALEPSETRSVHAPDFDRLVREHPLVHAVLTAILAERVRNTNELLVEALYVPADKRVLRRLVDLAALYGRDDGPALIPLTQEDIAGLAGTSRETVNRVLREEQTRGTIELARGRTTVRDLDELSRRAR
ncbi:MAG: Crp/Fnr family transcriptional regulator [Gaiellaceae bacterium]